MDGRDDGRIMVDGRTEGETDGVTNGRTDGRKKGRTVEMPVGGRQ